MSMSFTPDPKKILYDRVEFKLYSASYHLKEIKKLKENHAGIHDDMPSVHLEMEIDCFLSQIYGSIDALLVLINNELKLGFTINEVNRSNVKSKLEAIGRIDLLAELEEALQSGNWLSSLYELRNQSVHREKLRMMREYDAFTDQAHVYISKKQREMSLNPSDYMSIELVRYFEQSLENVKELVNTIRMKDVKLQSR
jgi:hypothetical protein